MGGITQAGTRTRSPNKKLTPTVTEMVGKWFKKIVAQQIQQNNQDQDQTKAFAEISTVLSVLPE